MMNAYSESFLKLILRSYGYPWFVVSCLVPFWLIRSPNHLLRPFPSTTRVFFSTALLEVSLSGDLQASSLRFLLPRSSILAPVMEGMSATIQREVY